ncbi:MAG: D-glycero-beta-D-manno-heptose 1-phosphate adenylyltransferase [Deltaproteobacteria bacterium]|nr:D-glycero-beta-D-manno-heptose 1-phosphate adenylyltransferase [Deltaproteobacteria bacterium]
MDKILSWESLKEKLNGLRKEGKTIVFTNGCFDILHVGHTRYLNEAKKTGDVFVLGLNSDSSVRALKGENRPINSEADRAYVLASLAAVDYVTIFSEETPLKLIEYLKPDIIVKGGDWKQEDVVGGDVVKKWGGKVLIMPETEGASSTNMIDKIVKFYGHS